MSDFNCKQCGALIVSTLMLVVQNYPSPDITPGATMDVSTTTLCQPGYTKTVRHTTRKMKVQAYYNYGMEYSTCCEVDHLIPLEIGGADVIENLWPQPYPEARYKDVVENYLHHEVCSGEISLEAAQYMIAHNWPRIYQKLKKRGGKKYRKAVMER